MEARGAGPRPAQSNPPRAVTLGSHVAFRCEPGGGFVSLANHVRHRTSLQTRPMVIETTNHSTPTRVPDITFEVEGQGSRISES